jgi:tetratricopeptide (TPR) repeat protein
MLGTAAVGMGLLGCGDQAAPPVPFSAVESGAQAAPEAVLPSELGNPATVAAAAGAAPGSDVDPNALLRAVVELVKSAPTNPGGMNFDIAKDYLNQYFAGTPESDFAHTSESRAYLSDRFGKTGERALSDLERKAFTVRDARHIEDCLLLSTIARRVAGNGDDVTRVGRVFDWLMEQVQLVPAGSLATPQGVQAQARPYDVLLRGMATEEGGWAERSWVFMALCRQLDLDAGIVLYTPPARSILAAGPVEKVEGKEGAAAGRQPVVWIVAVVIDGKPYLYDCRMGRPIPGVEPGSVATIEEVIANPGVLNRLDLPGAPYTTRGSDLGAGKLSLWVDSSLGQLSPRMRELQDRLTGNDRMVLFRDPAEQHAKLAEALGERFDTTELWPLPMEVEYRLFNDPGFVQAAQFAIAIFDAKLPLLPARLGQLRGDLDRAVESYAAFRFSDKPVQNDGKTPIPPPVQDVLDLYATYFLGLAKLDQGQPELARNFFEQTLRLLPKPSPGVPYFALYRWGAESNLGRIHARQGRPALAARYLASPQPTSQTIGNLLEARKLIWENPFVPEEAAPAAGAGATAAGAATSPGA